MLISPKAITTCLSSTGLLSVHLRASESFVPKVYDNVIENALQFSVSAVHNIKTVAHCVAKSFTYLRNAGLSPEKTTCVGHSLG